MRYFDISHPSHSSRVAQSGSPQFHCMMARGLTKPVRCVLHISVTRPYITPQSQWIVFQHNAITRWHETSQSQCAAFQHHTRSTLLIGKLRKAFTVQYESEPLIRFSTQSPHRVVRDKAVDQPLSTRQCRRTSTLYLARPIPSR